MRTLLIIGTGDVAQRALPALCASWHVLASCRSDHSAQALRAQGATPLRLDLDQLASLEPLANLADAILHCAPPQNHGRQDLRTRQLLEALAKGQSIPQRLVYISTSGVYGNANGAWLDEEAPLHPQNDRAYRRVDAEQNLSQFAQHHGGQLTILRAPGIYADERLPLSRFHSQAPLICHEEDSYSNHIHADDLARLCVAALQSSHAGIKTYNACDDMPLGISQWYQLLADTLQLPLPPLLPRTQVQAQVSPGLWSYMMESRRLDNRRLRQDFPDSLQWPNVMDYLAQLAQSPERLARIKQENGIL